MAKIPPSSARDEVIRLLLAMLEDDSDLKSASAHQLEELILSSREARIEYLSHVDLIGNLFWDGGACGNALAGASQPQASALPVMTPTAVNGGTWMNRLKRLPSWRRPSHSWNPFGSATAATFLVALVVYGVFFLVAWSIDKSWQRERFSRFAADSSDESRPVVTLVAAKGATWIGEQAYTGQSFGVGARLEATVGTAQFEFADGAVVVLRGPFAFEVQGESAAFLHLGKLSAHVPTQAIGFCVETSQVRVVDLGTEFSLIADKNGKTDVQVHRGKVAVHPSDKGKAEADAGRSFVLQAGEARRIQSDGPGGRVVVGTATPSKAPLIKVLEERTSAPPRSELIHYWTFDETDGELVQDAGSYPARLRLVGGAQFVKGQRGNAVSFDGQDDYVVGVSVPFTKDMNHTIAYWARHDDPQPVNGWQVHLCWGKSSARYLMVLSNNQAGPGNDGRMIFALGDSPVGKFTAAASLPVRSSWEYWTLVRKDEEVHLFKNGNFLETLPFKHVTGLIDSNGELRLGRDRVDIEGGFFHGALDDLAVWTIPLTQAQIQSAMTQGADQYQSTSKP